MKIEKGMTLKTPTGKIYEIAGWWNDAWVLVPKAKDDGQCWLYTTSEIEEELENGWQIIRKKGIQVESKIDQICTEFGQKLGYYIGTMDDVVEEFQPILAKLNKLCGALKAGKP